MARSCPGSQSDVDRRGHIGRLDSEMTDKDVSLSQVPTVWLKTRLAFKGCALWIPAVVLCHLQSPGEQWGGGGHIRRGKQLERAFMWFSQDTNESLFTQDRAPRIDQSSSVSQ